MLDIAFSDCLRSGDIARMHGISKRWVMALRLYVCGMLLACQNLVLGCLIMLASTNRPLFIMTRLAWDETGERLALGSGTEGCDTSVFHVLVARMRMLIAFEDPTGPEAPPKVFSYSFIMPPLVVPSTSAGNIYHALFWSEFTGPIFHAVTLLQQRARFVINLNETDGAHANDKLAAFLLSCNSLPNFLWEHLHCALHANQLVEASILTSLGTKILSRMYSLSLFLHTSGYFLRLVRMLKPMITDAIHIRTEEEHGRPTEQMVQYGNELRNYVMCRRNRFVRLQARIRHHWLRADNPHSESDGDGQTAPSQAERKFKELVDRFFKDWNGPLWDDSGITMFKFTGDTRSEDAIISDMALSARSFLYGKIPATPAANKWTKLGPCVDAIVVAELARGTMVK
ncbi:unnamed protein product [Prorocentrum cordatum]|uniref:Spindle pole body component n=1 Tax=Prorocentrum cordatum TaxID=2364126 RepID=A0ABN9XAV8_9DINO|nr:unnamed protein product [Polarella glacialis]